MEDQLHGAGANLFARDGGLHPPLDVIISWPAANLVDPKTRDWAGPVILIAVIAFTFVVFFARLWARLRVGRNAGVDDLLMCLAMFPLLGLTITVLLAIRTHGFQWHVWDQTQITLMISRKISLAIEVLYLGSTSLIKISILCFYRRMANGSISRIFVYCVWAAIVSVVLYAIIFTFVIIFTCTPVEGYWLLFDLQYRATHELQCRNEAAEIVSVVIISTVQDLVICALPIFLVWNLQISRRQKAGLIGIFAVGLLTCVCGIMRTYYAIYVYYYTYDITWYAYYGWIWTAVEADLGVICASAPALKIFFRRYFSSTIDHTGYSSYARAMTPQAGRVSNRNPRGASDVESGSWGTTPVPLFQIQVSTGMNVTIESRQERMSVRSDSSTSNLTALPTVTASADKVGTHHWVEGCRTLCEGLRPDSRNSNRNKSWDKNIERGV